MTAFFSAQSTNGMLTADIFAGGFLTIGILQDLILILISGLACLYCVILNRRVRGLSNMKTGLGASIVSLTDAIRQTQNAAKDTEVTTLKAIHTLQNLMDEAESTISKLEAKKIDLDRQVGRAAKLAGLQSQLVQRIETDLPNAILEADKIAASLRKAVNNVYGSDLNFRLDLGQEGLPIVETEETSEYAQLNEALATPPMTEQAPIETTGFEEITPPTQLQKTRQSSPPSKAVKPIEKSKKVTGKSKKVTGKSKKVTPLKKGKSRDIVNLGTAPSSTNKKVAS